MSIYANTAYRKSISGKAKLINSLNMVVNYYVTESMLVEGQAKAEPFKKSHEKWVEDAKEWKREFNSKLAPALFDYIVLICAGEARHGRSQCQAEIEEFPMGSSRGEIYRECTVYNPKNILERCYELFTEYSWGSSYGGQAWATIAESGLKYFKYPPDVFIDHVVDIAHNSSIAFDKTSAEIFFLYDGSTFKEFLDMKRYAKDLSEFIEFISDNTDCGILQSTYQLIKRGIVLGLVDVNLSAWNYIKEDGVFDLTYSLLKTYEPIIWGSEKLSEITPDVWEDDEDEDEEPTEPYSMFPQYYKEENNSRGEDNENKCTCESDQTNSGLQASTNDEEWKIEEFLPNAG